MHCTEIALSRFFLLGCPRILGLFVLLEHGVVAIAIAG